MSRHLDNILKDFWIVQTTKKTGLEYPYKTSFTPETGGTYIRLSPDEVDFIEKELVKMRNKFPELYEMLKTKYSRQLSIDKVAIKMQLSSTTAHRILSEAKGYILGKLDENIEDLTK